MSKSEIIASVHGTVGASHYAQAPGVHPKPNRIPDGFERVELLTGGRGWLEHEGEWIELTAGSLAWQVPGDYTISRSDFEDPYHCLNITFRTDLRRSRPVARVTRWSDMTMVRAFTEEVVNLWIQETVSNTLLTQYAYSRLYLQALIGHKRSEQSRFPEPLRKAQDFINANYHKRIPISEVAAEADISEPHLYELFRSHLKGSPHQMILERRLQEACRRLASTSDPIKQIGVELGFSSASAFSSAFRKFARLTPAAYRNRSRQFG